MPALGDLDDERLLLGEVRALVADDLAEELASRPLRSPSS